MDKDFSQLNGNDDALSILDANYQAIMTHPMFKTGQLIDTAQQRLLGGGGYYNQRKDSWFQDGIDCEILRLGANQWKKGKVRIRVTLEFCPNEPEEMRLDSPLDDIRQSITEND